MAALLELAPLLVALVCLLIAAVLVVIVTAAIRFVASIVGKVPFLGDILVSHLDGLNQALWHALGVAFKGADSALGWMLHSDARLLDWTWKELRSHAAAILAIADPLGAALAVLHGIRALVHSLTHLAHGITKAVKTLEREYHGIEHRVKTLEHDIAKGIGHDLRLEIKALKRRVHAVDEPLIRAAQDAADAARAEADNLYDWAKGKASLIGVGTFAYAVGAVLAAVGLDWIACNKRNSVNGKRGCNLWDDIEGLLGLATAALVATELETLAKEMQALERPVTTVIADLTGVADKLGL